jgi:hypothetical protein
VIPKKRQSYNALYFCSLQLEIPKAALFTIADRQVVAVRANRRHEWDKEEPMTSAVMGS